MAVPESVIQEARVRTTRLMDEMDRVHTVLALVEGVGATDQERVAFFAPFFAAAGGTYDIDSNTFLAGVQKLRELRTWWTTAANYKPINALRVRV